MGKKNQKEVLITETTETITAKVNGGNLNIRADKSLDAEVVGVLQNDSEVIILDKGKEWCKIAGGYVMSQFLKF